MAHIWHTRDNRKIPVTDMTNRHVQNTERYLKNAVAHENHIALAMCAYIGNAPDGAAHACEQELDGQFDKALNAEAWLSIMRKERERRNLVELS